MRGPSSHLTWNDPVQAGSGKGGFCHRFCLIAYMDDLSVKLKECQTGCIAGGTIVNHLMYADDIVLPSPSATGLSLLLHVQCTCMWKILIGA